MNSGNCFSFSDWDQVLELDDEFVIKYSTATEISESPVSVFGYPISDSAPGAPTLSGSSFRFSGPWVDLDTEMLLWRSTQPPIFSQSCYNSTHQQLDSSDGYKPERSALEQNSIAEESDAKRKLGVLDVATKPNKKKPSKKPRIAHTPISRLDLELQFGKTRKEAASCLDVSISTLKRSARECGISRWPFNKKSKGGFNVSANLVVLKIPNSDQNAPIASEQLVTTEMKKGDERSMIVKVKYKADFIKFVLSSLSKMADLQEEVSKRLKLKVGSFEIKYMDEDEDWVSLPCDDDLEYCMRSLGETTIKMLVLPVTT